MQDFEMVLPTFITLPRKTKADKRISINLNSYRNLCPILKNQTKILFKNEIQGQLNKLPFFTSISLDYYLFVGTKRLCDISNVLSIEDKYFCDALVETGHLEDDNYNFIKDIGFHFGGYEKNNPYVKLILHGEVQ